MTNRYYSGPASDHFDGIRFFNPGQPSTDRSLTDLLRWHLGGNRAPWTPAPTGQAMRRIVPARSVDNLAVTLIGHASLLIQAAGRNLLVDPVYAERASPVQWAGPRRVNPPGVAFDDLPPIDAVLLTHNHYDHLDIPALRRLWQRDRPRLLAPLGNDRVVANAAPEVAVETLDWGQSLALDGGLTVWLHPAYHWSSRGLTDRRMALWGGFVIRPPAGCVYVAGDTGYGDGRIFRDVRTRYGAPDLAILPIGAYEPRWFMKDQHVNPAEAVQIMLDCGAAQALGVHWGTFQLTDEPLLAPAQALARELDRRGLDAGRFQAMTPGDRWRASGLEARQARQPSASARPSR